MVAKVYGFLAGAGVAAVAIFGFNSWRHVGDEDLLTAVIADHCIPYAKTGATPFEDMGRSAGVYERAFLSDQFSDGGHKILFDGRFIAQWVTSVDGGSAVRVCKVDYNLNSSGSVGFDFDTQELVVWINETIADDNDLAFLEGEVGPMPSTLAWYASDTDRFEGLRLVLTAQDTGVSGVMVVDDVEP